MKSVMLCMAVVLALLCVGILRVKASEQNYAEQNCMISAGPCIKMVNGLTVTFDVNPKPLKAMRILLMSTTITNKGRPVTDATVSISLSMPGMFMGQNVIRLTHLHGGRYEGKGVIVRCPSGNKVWQASVSIQRAGMESIVNYVFEVPER